MFGSLIEPDDIDQEVALRELEGKVVSRGIVTVELNRKATHDPSLPEHLVAVYTAEPHEHEILREWAQGYSEEVVDIIEAFLGDPESQLEQTIHNLSNLGIQLSPVPTEIKPRPRVTYKDILSRALPATQDQLIQALSRCPINRPASTVRQFLRRHRPHLWKDELGQYHWKADVLGGNRD